MRDSQRALIYKKHGSGNANGNVQRIQHPYLYIGRKKPWKLCLNLWARKWLKPTRKRVRYFTPTG